MLCPGRPRVSEAAPFGSAALSRAPLDHAHDAVIMGDMGRRIVIDANPRACALLGYTREELVGMPVMDMYPCELREPYVALFDAHVAGGGPGSFELVMRHRDGSDIPVAASIAIVDVAGRPVMQSTFRDISAFKAADRAPGASENNMKSIVEGLPVPAVIVGIADHRRVLYANAKAEALLAIAVGAPFPGWDSADGYMEGREMQLPRPNGSLFWAEVSAQPIRYDGELASLAVFFDIDMRKRSEAQLRQEAEFRQTLIESAAEGICTWQRSEDFPYVHFAVWNQRMCEITGYTMRQINTLGWTQMLYPTPERQEAARRRMAEVEAGGRLYNLETEIVTKAGKPRSLRISSVPVAMDGEGTWVLAIMEDVTEQRELEANLRQVQKIEALGTLVGGIAHDFNNILTGMLGNIYLALSDAEAQPGLVEKLQVAEALGFRAADLISQLLTFARKGRVNMQALELAGYLRELFGKGLLSLPENIGLKTDFCEEELPVRGDATQIQQVLMNLISNARGALRGRREPMVTVHLERFVPNAHFRRAHGGKVAGTYARLSVSDNGEGIDPANLERIFEPFFTTKDVGEGTGLGLAMVYSIVQGHGGLVEVDSRPGEGTSFHLYLPLSEGEARVPAAVTGRVPEGHGELILLADDEPDVRRSVAEVIGRLGYRVLVAGDGEQAWALFRAHRADIALAILDVVMPGLSGVEAAARMRELNPGLPIILATGYDAGDELAHAEVSRVLSKPFRVDVLARAMRKALEES